MSSSKKLRVDILSIFPEAVEPYLQTSMLKRGQEKKLLDLRVHQLRTWTHDTHQSVDDKPFGGGPGMVMKVQPFHEALVALRVRTKEGERSRTAKKTRVILTSAKGKLFSQQDARRLMRYERLVFLCGRYEGVDERVATELVDEELSIGPYVLTGGELAALVMTDAVARLRSGVLGAQESLEQESYDAEGVLEYPQFTRPEEYIVSKKKKWSVPKILLSGNHQKIAEWRRGSSKSL